MDTSHVSCAEDYGLSCPELDTLAAVAREGGALGARLTGAGFGGCAVSLVPEDCVGDFTKHVQEAYYADYLHKTDLPPDCIIPAQTAAGAEYILA